MTQTTEMVRRVDGEMMDPGVGGLMPVMSIQQAVGRYNAVIEFTKTVMKPDTDFGIIPGTNNKPTLLKPGAEKLCALFGLSADFEEHKSVEDWDRGLFYYAFKAKLLDRHGRVVGSGIGSCNSREKKYRWRNAERVCPECKQPSIRRSSFPPKNNPRGEPGWYCHSKAGGCGRSFAPDDQRILSQQGGKVENTETFDLVNTIQKLAQKRALIAAVLVVTNASEFFTQDQDDLIAPAARDDDAEPVLDVESSAAEQAVDFSDPTAFLNQWLAVAQYRGAARETAEAFINGALEKVGKTLAQTSMSERQKALADLHAGSFDRHIMPPPAPGNGSAPAAAAPAPPARSKKSPAAPKPAASKPTEAAGADNAKLAFEAWKGELKQIAQQDLQMSRVEFETTLAKLMLGFGLKGREWELSADGRSRITEQARKGEGPWRRASSTTA